MKKLGLQQKIIGLFLGLFLPVVAFCLWQQVQYYSLLRENISDYTMQLIEKISYDIGQGIKELDSAILGVLYDKNTALYLLEPENDSRLAALSRQMDDAKAMLRMGSSADCNIVLLSSNRKVVASTYEEWTGSSRALSSEWLNRIAKANGDRVIVSAYDVRRESGSIVTVVAIARSVRYEGERQGILLLEIPVGYFYSFCKGVDFGQYGYLLLVDQNNYILYSTDARRIGDRFYDDDHLNAAPRWGMARNAQSVFSIPLNISDSSLQTVAVVSSAQMKREIDVMFWQMVAVIGVLGICLLAIFIVAARSLCRPIIVVCAAMKQLESGDFHTNVKQTSRDEIGDLQRGFNHMAKRLGELVDKEYVLLVREREAQLNDLARMMNPHFLYNTLEAISMTAYLTGDEKTVQMLRHLADIYRVSSEQGGSHCLRQELKHAEDYLYLINIRYDGRLYFHKSVDPALQDCECRRFILQPLVENCVLHGFEEHRNTGDIWLAARESEGAVVLTVEDNGVGMEDEKLEELRAILADDAIQMENYPSMAVKNIHDRLRLLYGAPSGITVGRAPQGGMSVQVLYPLLRKDRCEHD